MRFIAGYVICNASMKSYVRSRDQYNDVCVTNHLRLLSKKSVEYWVVKLENMGKSHGSILSSVSAVV